MKQAICSIILVALQSSGAHALSPCDTTPALNGHSGSEGFAEAVRRSLGTSTIAPTSCNSYLSVLRLLMSSKSRAGSQLKGSSGPDPAKAVSEIASLRRDVAHASALDEIQKEPSAFTRAMLEASHFHANGMYTARDLRIQEARKLVEEK